MIQIIYYLTYSRQSTVLLQKRWTDLDLSHSSSTRMKLRKSQNTWCAQSTNIEHPMTIVSVKGPLSYSVSYTFRFIGSVIRLAANFLFLV